MRVLLIPEDFRKDQYVIKPLVEAVLRRVGRPRANVRVLTDPLLAGVDQALAWTRIKEVLERYRGMVDVFLLLVDRDGDEHRRARIDALEKKAAEELRPHQVFLGEHAWQEVEVWLLAGQRDLPSDWSWEEIRRSRDPKEEYYLPYVLSKGLHDSVGEGRKELGRSAAANYGRIRQRCKEDVRSLEDRLRKCWC